MSVRLLAFQLGGKAVSMYARLPWSRGRGFLTRCATRLAPEDATCRIRRGNLFWTVDPIHGGMIARELFFHGTYEPESTGWVRGFVQPGWVCVDVGANIGYYTLLLA